MKILNVKMKYVLPYHPQSNGIGTIEEMIAAYLQKTQKEWANTLPHTQVEIDPRFT